MMIKTKHPILSILFLCFSVGTFAQTVAYELKKDIPYYETGSQDAYIAERCKLDIYYPTNKKDFATVIWFHGGSLTGGNKEIPEVLKGKGLAVIGVGYRLSPRAKGREIIEDATAAVAWVFKHIAEYGGSDKLLFISGHSAGGYLGMMLTLNKQYLNKYGIDANNIAELIPFSGQAITHFTIRKEYGMKDTQPLIDQYAPLYYVRADAPPMLLITGDREMELLGRYDENAYLARMMKLVGHKTTRLIELQGYGHDMTYPGFPLLIQEVERRTKEIMMH